MGSITKTLSAISCAFALAACTIGPKNVALENSCSTPVELPTQNADELSVLVFNIHDRYLFESKKIKKAQSLDNLVCIADMASNFDLVMFQEAYVNPNSMAARAEHTSSIVTSFEGHKDGNANWFPLNVICDVCQTPGLQILTNQIPLSIHEEPFISGYGWDKNKEKTDSLYSKGFQIIEFAGIWVLNTHMDAGRGPKSVLARREQVQQILETLDRIVPENAPLLLAGDLNLKPHITPEDQLALDNLMKGANLDRIIHDGPDHIAGRNLKFTQSSVLPLKNQISDHNALTTSIDIQ